jgi:hypothetical protein
MRCSAYDVVPFNETHGVQPATHMTDAVAAIVIATTAPRRASIASSEGQEATTGRPRGE